MAHLNERTEKTQGVIHLLVTPLCKRKCKFCCNKQYNLADVPSVTDEELKAAHTLCLTGGEPFLFANPCEIASYYKSRYPNIKNVYVYTNARELNDWLGNNRLAYIDGLCISVKDKIDANIFNHFLSRNEAVRSMKSNRLYVFEDLIDCVHSDGFETFHRQWQEDFQPADDSIFRRM